jgi:hypothetical protein
MKNIKFIPIAFILLCLSSFKLNNNEDIVASFENLLKNHFDSYISNPREKTDQLGGGWVQAKYKLSGEYKYDVQQTSSLVSPYTGYCEFSLKRSYTDFHKTKDDALLDTIFIKSDEVIHKHYYSYQKGKWKISKREHKGYTGWYDCNEVLKKDNSSNIHGCWENNFGE